MIKEIFVFFVGVFLATAALAHEMPEGTTCQVNGVTVECDDPHIYDAHDPNCAYMHYHGELAGVGDPDPNGCGHGLVQSVAPTEEEEEEEEESSSAWNTFTDWLDALFQGISGGFSPKTVSETVDIVEDATPSIKETAENAEEYFDTYEDAPDRDRYTLEDENPEENAPIPSLYRWFWSWFE